MNAEAVEFMSQLLSQEYGERLPDLEPAATTSYSRLTLVDLEAGARLTCDVDLVCSQGDHQARGSDMILVESKSSGSGSVADAALRQMGVRPIGISKYCIAVALLHRTLAPTSGTGRCGPTSAGRGSSSPPEHAVPPASRRARRRPGRPYPRSPGA